MKYIFYEPTSIFFKKYDDDEIYEGIGMLNAIKVDNIFISLKDVEIFCLKLNSIRT